MVKGGGRELHNKKEILRFSMSRWHIDKHGVLLTAYFILALTRKSL